MKVLISPISLEEARIVADGGADIVDIKNVNEGSLGAQMPWVIREIVTALADYDVLISATIGDLPFKPGTAAQAAAGAASCGVGYVKAGLHGVSTHEEALAMATGIVKAIRMVNPDALAVIGGYADYHRFGGLDPQTLAAAAAEARADVVMLDTAIKDGKNLMDAMSIAELNDFVVAVHQAGLLAALAGSVAVEHIRPLAEMQTDFVGVRGAVCGGADRHASISRDKVTEFVAFCRETAMELAAKPVATG
jgi:uncharacterized protein (UPF0264 family)